MSTCLNCGMFDGDCSDSPGECCDTCDHEHSHTHIRWAYVDVIAPDPSLQEHPRWNDRTLEKPNSNPSSESE